jgi:Protein of unknown function (DUF1570)
MQIAPGAQEQLEVCPSKNQTMPNGQESPYQVGTLTSAESSGRISALLTHASDPQQPASAIPEDPMRQRSVPNRCAVPAGALHCSRRGWLAQALAGVAGLRLTTWSCFAQQVPGDADEAKEIADVKALALEKRLGRFSENRTMHFLGLGDADAAYCKSAITICEALTKDFLAHFRERGFKLEMPPGRLTVITLKDDASYRAWAGDNPGATVGGHYDPPTNRLVVFDFRNKQEDLATSAERVNLFTLVHEAAHQLSFNTGLLPRNQDVPACIAEGLATYAELWRTKGKGKLGAFNRPRLETLIDRGNGAAAWIPIDKLLTDDDLFDKEETAQAAYAESWLLTNYLLKRGSPQLAKFHVYLAKIAEPQRAKTRAQIAEEVFGSLDELNREIYRSAQKLIREGR